MQRCGELVNRTVAQQGTKAGHFVFFPAHPALTHLFGCGLPARTRPRPSLKDSCNKLFASGIKDKNARQNPHLRSGCDTVSALPKTCAAQSPAPSRQLENITQKRAQVKSGATKRVHT